MDRSEFLLGLAMLSGPSSVRSKLSGSSNARTPFRSLGDYFKFSGSARLIDPQEYISYIRTLPRFKHIDIHDITKFGVVLHDARVEDYLIRLGFIADDWYELQTGTTDPNLLYVVRKKSFGLDFVLNRGLPGAGGITTQVAELFALGVRYVTHIGTCGLLGTRLPLGKPIVSNGCYKDAASVMLSVGGDTNRRLAPVDRDLKTAIGSGTSLTATGYTIPIFYFQPEG